MLRVEIINEVCDALSNGIKETVLPCGLEMIADYNVENMTKCDNMGDRETPPEYSVKEDYYIKSIELGVPLNETMVYEFSPDELQRLEQTLTHGYQ